MSMFGQVSVKNNQYKLKGAFHHMTPNTPIRDADNGWKLLGITNPRDMTYIHSYGGEAIFFESLSQGKLLATRCDSKDCETAGTIYIPFRIHCPECLGKNTVIDLTDAEKKAWQDVIINAKIFDLAKKKMANPSYIDEILKK